MRRIIIVVLAVLVSESVFAALYARDLDGNFSNGHEGVYDDVLNITWLANARLAETITFGLAGIGDLGQMDWSTAEAYVAAMNAFNSGAGYFGVSNWRQPTVEPLDGSTFDLIRTYDGSSDESFQLSAPVDPIFNPNGQSEGFTGSELAYHYYNNFEAIGGCSGVGTSCDVVQPDSVKGLDNAIDSHGYKALFINIESQLSPTRSAGFWTGTDVGSTFAFEFEWNSGGQIDATKSAAQFVWAVTDGDHGVAVVPLPAAAWFFLSALGGLIGVQRIKD